MVPLSDLESPQDHTRELVGLILDNFSDTHDVAIGIVEKDGDAVFSDRAETYFSPLCKLLRKYPRLWALCEEDHRRRGAGDAPQGPGMCHCGLNNYAMPIVVDAVRQGVLLCGQRRPTRSGADESEAALEAFLDSQQLRPSVAGKLRAAYIATDTADETRLEGLGRELANTCQRVCQVYYERREVDRRSAELTRRTELTMHEIQLCNAAVLSAAEELRRFVALGDRASAYEIARVLPDQLEYLGMVATNLLWLSAPHISTIVTEDIRNPLDDACRLMEWYASQEGVEVRRVELRARTLVPFSHDHISLVFRNLLHNAIKYSYRGNEAQGRDRYVRVVTDADTRSDRCRVSFQNFGIGIDQEELARVFDRHVRGANTKDEHRSGQGIGLAISDEIIRQHGGRIRATCRKLAHGGPSLVEVSVYLPYSRSEIEENLMNLTMDENAGRLGG
ncbi:MAG: PocR ligand-binding domain-containing protein [Coriobacteriia bacterium]|nr:PocR ligand-binding domain-containing protein [Coriobacteriia bacterium]